MTGVRRGRLWRIVARMGRATRSDPQLAAAVAVVSLEVLLIGIGPLVAPYSATASSLADQLEAPSFHHLLGTDSNGTDILSRLLVAPRVDLVVAIAATVLAAAVGAPLGLLAGYVRGRLTEALMRISDVVLAFPVFVLALVVVAALGAGEGQTILVVGFVQAPIYLRLMYSLSVSVAQRPFVESARLSGVPRRRVLARHLFPNTLAPLFVQLSITIGLSVLLVSGLSYVGAGVQAPTPEWGSMIATGADSLIAGQWWPSVFPGIAIGVTVVAFAVLSERLSVRFQGVKKTGQIDSAVQVREAI